MTVTYNDSTSAPFAATVVKSKPAVFTQDQSGTGLATVQNFISNSPYQVDLNRFTTNTINAVTISPAKPGQVMIAWGTGLGPVPFADNTAASAYDFIKDGGANVQVIVGGTSITPAYAGRAPGFASEDQIVFTLPSNVQTGCTVPFQISVNGVLSTATFIAIAPSSGDSACVQPGFTTAQLQNFDNGATVSSGSFVLAQVQETVPSYSTMKVDTVGGSFTRFSGFQLAALSSQLNVSTNTQGACTVIQVSGTASALASGNATGLDAGTISLNGPSGSGITNLALKEDPNSYSYYQMLGTEGIAIPGQANYTLVAGPYALAGAGGRDVGSFNVSLNLGSPLNLNSPLPSTVTRNAGLSLAWTGGNASDTVQIFGYSGTTSGSGSSATINATEFICKTTAGANANAFTVPASVLMQLPAVTSAAVNSGTGAGFLQIQSGPAPTVFTPALTAGGTINSTFSAMLGIGSVVAYQ